MNFDRLGQKRNRDSFEFYESIFMRVGGHFFFRTAIQHGHAFSAKAPRHGGAVNRGVTGADNDYVAADVQLRRLKFAAFDVFKPIQYVLFSRNSQLRQLPRPTPMNTASKFFCSSVTGGLTPTSLPTSSLAPRRWIISASASATSTGSRSTMMP